MAAAAAEPRAPAPGTLVTGPWCSKIYAGTVVDAASLDSKTQKELWSTWLKARAPGLGPPLGAR